MKRNVLFIVALFATMAASAQNIAAVSPGNVTTMYQTLDDAVTKAEEGSVIYLPGGGFQIKDESIITKQLTIVGVSHRGDADNADGATIIAGNLNFGAGSSNSSVTGVFVSGNIIIGNADNPVENITVLFCNASSIQVKSSNSNGLVVNQCYLRNNSNFSHCNATIKNTILHSAQNINGGTIDHCVVTSTFTRPGYTYAQTTLYEIKNSKITNNFILNFVEHTGSNCIVSNNCRGKESWGQDPIVFEEGESWDTVFEKNKGTNNSKGVSIYSNYKLAGTFGKNAATDGTDIGIYGGSGFKDDKSLAPIPRIVSKKVAEHTDGSGKLHIEVTVKAD